MSSNLKNPTDLSGVLGEEVRVKKVGRDVVFKNRPRKTAGPPTAKQEEAQERFTEAADYAKSQMAIPESKADYEKGITDKKPNAFVVALTDFLKAPKVKEINTKRYKGAVGDVIKIRAIDDFRVTEVQVTILAADGSELESGNAVQLTSKRWGYTATVANPQLLGTIIKVTAFDKPGNETEAEKTL